MRTRMIMMDKKSHDRKAQSGIMEYMIFVVMVIALIFIVVVVLLGFQMFTVGGEKAKMMENKLDYILDSFIVSPLVNNPRYPQGLVFDDSKLTALVSDPDSCKVLEKAFGTGWYAEIDLSAYFENCEDIKDSGGYAWRYRYDRCVETMRNMMLTKCNSANYPDCGSWELCKENKKEKMRSVYMPVNIYRKLNNTITIGIIRIGVSGE